MLYLLFTTNTRKAQRFKAIILQMTIDIRRLIERWKKEGKSNREIASLLGKTPQTIHTEIKRGTVLQCLEKGRL